MTIWLSMPSTAPMLLSIINFRVNILIWINDEALN